MIDAHEPAAQADKIRVLQILRALAALAVAQAHMVDTAIAHHQFAYQCTVGSFENLGAIGVDLFFVISGFIVPLSSLRSRGGRWEFLARRATRIYPIWWIAVAGEIACRGFGGRLGTRDLMAAVWSALLVPSPLQAVHAPVVVLGWSLIFEMYFYGLIALLWGPGNVRLQRTLAAVSVLGLVGVVLHPDGRIIATWANSMLLDFAMGLAIGILWLGRWSVPRPLAWLAIAGGTAAILASGYFGYGDISEYPRILDNSLSALRVLRWGVPCAAIMLGCVLWSPPCTSWAGRLLVALGDASYSIYLASFFLQKLFSMIWPVFAFLPGDAAIMAGVCVVGGVGRLSYSWLEMPILDWCKRHILSHFRPPVDRPAEAVAV